jgi:hypothetical protein
MTPQIIHIIVALVVYAIIVTGLAGFWLGKLCGRRH